MALRDWFKRPAPDSVTRTEPAVSDAPETASVFMTNGRAFELKAWDDDFLKGKLFNIQQAGGIGGLASPYRQHEFVYKCIRKNAESVAAAPWRLRRKGTDKVVESGPEFRLFRDVNPTLNRFQLWEGITTWLMMNGEAFIAPIESIGQQAGLTTVPAGIRLLDPRKVKERIVGGELQYWTYGNERLAPEDITHIQLFNPFNPYRGMGPMEVARGAADLDFKAMIYNRSFFDGGAVPVGLLKPNRSMKSDKRKRALESFKESHEGVDKRNVGMLPFGVDYQEVGMTHRDMEYPFIRQDSPERIMTVFGTNEVVMGRAAKDLNRATAYAMKRLYYEQTIEPIWMLYEAEMESSWFPRYMPDYEGFFDREAVAELQDMLSERILDMKGLEEAGLTPDEAAEYMKLKIPKGKNGRNRRLVPFNLVPVEDVIGATGRAATAPAGAGGAPKAVTKNLKGPAIATFNRARRPIEKRMARGLKKYFYALRRAALAEADDALEELSGRPDVQKAELDGLDWAAWEKRIQKENAAGLAASHEAGITLAEEMVGATTYTLRNPNAQAFLSNKSFQMRGITRRIRRRIDESLSLGIRNGETIEDLKNRIRREFSYAEARSSMIARTEVTGAMNGGQVAVFGEAGVEKKEWLANDESEVESHGNPGSDRRSYMQGEIVALGKTFSNGLEFPGGNGPAEEVVNCNCTLLPVIETE